MRCLACGGEMRLQQTRPDEVISVPGYEVQTLQCVVCRETEHRPVFRSEPSVVAAVPASVGLLAAMANPGESPLGKSLLAEGEKSEGAFTSAITPHLQAREPERGDPDEGAEMLRRAIEMVRSPIRGAPPRGLIDHRQVAPEALAGTVRGDKPARVVQIRHDPSYEAAYAAKDTRSGL